MDPGIDDIATGQVNAAGDPVKQPGMIRCDHCHQGGPARGIILGMDVELRALGGLKLGQVHRDDIVRLGDPIGIAEQLGMARHQGFVRAKPLGHHSLLGRNPLAAPMLDMTQPQPFFGRIIKFVDQLALPAVPDPRANRANIDDGQHREQPQPLDRLHRRDEIGDGLPVGQITLERHRAHQQVRAHQPRGQLGFVGRHTQPRAQLKRYLCAQF